MTPDVSHRRIAFIIPTLGRGGTEGHLLKLCKGLRQIGWSTQVVCWFGAGELAGSFRDNDIDVAALHARTLLDPLAMIRMMVAFRQASPHVVHSYMFGFDILPFLPARITTRAALISSRREMAKWMRPHHVAVQIIGNLLTDRVIACSRRVASCAAERERLSLQQFSVVYNGVALHPEVTEEARREKRRSLNLPPNVLVVGIVARMVTEKAYEVFVRSARLVKDRLSGTRFVCVGDGDARRLIETMVTELGMANDFHLLGEREDALSLMAAFDVGVLCSHTEGMPNVVLEYMAAGLPVVATEVGGVPEAVNDQVGTLVPPGDSRVLADAIFAILVSPSTARAMGRRGRAHVLQRFTIDGMVDAHADIYEAELRRRSVRSARSLSSDAKTTGVRRWEQGEEKQG